MNMKKYVIKLNGKVYEVEMGEAGAGTPVAMPASAPAAAPAASAPAAPTAPAAPVAGGEIVTAPMPGNIIDVKVKVGDTVAKDQVIFVLEAMKMENEIVAPRAGQVVAVNINKGDVVNPGETMVVIG